MKSDSCEGIISAATINDRTGAGDFICSRFNHSLSTGYLSTGIYGREIKRRFLARVFPAYCLQLAEKTGEKSG
jgi:hypothetical protein